jgi:GT2 family glycosyltransferase
MRASLIIAAHNEGEHLWKTVQACWSAIGGLDCEIVVSDDASTDDSIDDMLRRFPRVRVIRTYLDEVGRNTGCLTSTGTNVSEG